MDFKKFVKELSREEKEVILTQVMDSIQMEDSTENFQENAINNNFCPHCQSENIMKNGHSRGVNRSVCKDCERTFSLTSKTVFERTKKDLSKWYEYIGYMFDGLSVRKIADKIGINPKTAFYWRHKILNLIKESTKDKLGGIVEADETFFNVSEKGSKKLNRKPKKRGEPAKKRGISKDKVCVVVACNREQESYSQSACLGRLNRKSLDNVLSGKIEQDATLVVDGLTAYREFSKNHNIKLKQLKSGQRVSGKYHIQTVNQYHGGLKSFIRQFKGVATKYLDNYLTFFRVTKLVNNDVFNRMMSVNIRITNNELNNMKMELV